MFGLNTIARRLPLALVGSAAIVSLGVGLGGYLIGSQMVGNMTEHNLSSLAYERAKQLQDAYQVAGVPSLGIARRWYVDGELARSMDRALQVTDFLIGES